MKKNYIPFLLLSSLVVIAKPCKAQGLQQKAMTLCRFLEINHYQPVQWNDSTSIRLYTRWMNILDDEKFFFCKTDIDQLQEYKTKLDDELLGKIKPAAGTSFFDKSIGLYKMRLKQVDSISRAILQKPLDFSKPDNIHQPFADYAATPAELQQRWLKIIKWNVLREIATNSTDSTKSNTAPLKVPSDFATLETNARKKQQHHFETLLKNIVGETGNLEKQLEEVYYGAISWCYDPHTNYMSMSSKKEFTTELSGFEYSTGLDVNQNEDGNYELSHLEPGGPAWRSGELHTGDIITKIKKGNEPEQELTDLEEDEVADLMKGNSDDKIIVTVKTPGGTQKNITLVKEKITADEGIVKSYVLQGRQKIGYIQLPGFYSREDEDIVAEDKIKYDGCANDMSKEIVKLKKDSIAGLILDLRFNGGGSMWEAIQLAGIFIDMGPVCSVKNKDGKVHFLKDPNRGTIYDGPLLVLVNGSSASASELTGAVLQDYNRALIVGSTTYGKGTAQSVFPMDTLLDITGKKKYDDYSDFVKVTGGKFYRIDGTTTQWKGVVPDIALPDIYQEVESRESNNASALLPDLSKKGIYQPLPLLPVAALQNKSMARVKADSSFAAVIRFNNWIMQKKKSNDIPLQWLPYISQFKNAMHIYHSIDAAEDKFKNNISAANNSFDAEKINLTAEQGRILNQTHLTRIAADKYVYEAYNILQDWFNIK